MWVKHYTLSDIFFFKQKTAYEMRISDWSSDVCSSDLEIRETEAEIQTPDGLVTIENDFVLSMTGYQPNFDFLRRIGIHLSDDEKLYPTYLPDRKSVV